MKKFFKYYINDRNKLLRWYNTNYFYAFTIAFSIILLTCYFTCNAEISYFASYNSFSNAYLVSFYHSNIIHVSYNTIIFVLLSLLLERHFGTFTYFIMLIFIIPISNIACFATDYLIGYTSGWSGCGESCVNCFLLGLYLVVLLVHFKQYILSKRVFLSLIPLGLVMFYMSIDSTVIHTTQDFFTHPSMQFMHALSNNITAHLAPFVAGVVVSALIYTILLTNKFHASKLR